MEIDSPEVLAEVTAAFNRYEKALVTNDVAVLDETFRVDPRTIRYGAGEILYGHAEIAAFRAARSAVGLARSVRNCAGAPRYRRVWWKRGNMYADTAAVVCPSVIGTDKSTVFDLTA